MNTIQKLPQNLTSEMASVSILSQIPGSLPLYAWDEKLFLDPACKRVFRHILEARSQGGEANKIDLRARMEAAGELEAVGGQHALDGLLETFPLPPFAGPTHAEFFHQDLVEACARREIILAAAELDADLRSGQISAEDYLSRLTDAGAMPEARKVETSKSQLTALLDEIENHTPPECFGFGIPSLDRELDGGFQRGELITVAGPTGGGKSLMLAQTALAAARAGKAVAFFSLEMPTKAVWRRLVANLANVALPKPHERPNAQQEKALSPAINAAAKLPLTIHDSLHSLVEIEAESRRLIKLGKADLIVVDYAQKVRHSGGERREQEVAEVTSRLKSLALKSHVAVVTASQLNKDGDVRESAAIEFDSDILLKITSEGIYCQKFRRGPCNWTVGATMRGELGRFDEQKGEWRKAA
ncbi:MAG: DnaB-like helicase C-terminal domain-containing protein [Verrucomicrobiae bacterium]